MAGNEAPSKETTAVTPAEPAAVGMEVVVTPAAPDLVCWLWAAFPPRRGWLQTSKIAVALGVSAPTVRRWIRANASELNATRVNWSPLDEASMKVLRRRAILRGRGHYLWPPADPATLERSRGSVRHAVTARQNLLELGPSPRDRQTGRDGYHEVHLVHFPVAHVFGVASSYNVKTLAKIMKIGEVLQTITVPDKHAAVIVKETALELIGAENRCIAPRQLVPTGRTETWLETAGDVDLEAIADQLQMLTPVSGENDADAPEDEQLALGE